MALPEDNYETIRRAIEEGKQIVKRYACPRCKYDLLGGVSKNLTENSYIYWSGSHVWAKCSKCGSAIQMWARKPGCPCEPWGEFMAHWFGWKCPNDATRVLAYKKYDSSTNSELVYFDYLCETHYQERLAGKKPWRRFHLGISGAGAVLLAGAFASHYMTQHLGDARYILIVPVGCAGAFMLYKGLMGMLTD